MLDPIRLHAAEEVHSNARIRYLPDEQGVYRPYELVAFNRSSFKLPGWETVTLGGSPKKKPLDLSEIYDEAELHDLREKENRRKSYMRARNNLFDLLMCTVAFDTFVTLTLDPEKIDRFDYAEIMKRWRVWFDNRVRRRGLVYAFVPERHKSGAIHFHGLCNGDALDLVRAHSPYTGAPISDNEGRPVYNVADFPLGFTTAITLSGDNARQATAKYCYKYITKSGGEKVGGRYYLSGGALGRPQYAYVNVDFEKLTGKTFNVCGSVQCKKVRLQDGTDNVPVVQA